MSAAKIIILVILGYLAIPVAILLIAVIVFFLREAIGDLADELKHRKAAKKKAEEAVLTAKGNSDLPSDLRAFGRTAPQQTKSASPDDEKPEA